MNRKDLPLVLNAIASIAVAAALSEAPSFWDRIILIFIACSLLVVAWRMIYLNHKNKKKDSNQS